MTSPHELEHQFTLVTATIRYNDLRTQDALAPPPDTPGDGDGHPLTQSETLEMLALGELIARKAGYGRQLAVRSARAAGASWSQIGLALGTTKQSAWEAHTRWIDDQAEQRRRSGYEGWDDEQVATARDLAGHPDDPPPHVA